MLFFFSSVYLRFSVFFCVFHKFDIFFGFDFAQSFLLYVFASCYLLISRNLSYIFDVSHAKCTDLNLSLGIEMIFTDYDMYS